MSKKNDKTYSPEEVAMAVLAKAQEMLSKSNTAHEIEAGEEPHNDDAEAPEYLANADIEESGQKKKNKKQSEEDREEMDHEDEMEDREIAEEEAEEEVEEHEDEYHKSEHPVIKEYNRVRDAESEAKLKSRQKKERHEKKRSSDSSMRTADAMVSEAKKQGIIKKEHQSVEQAAKEVMGDKDLDEVLDQMPSHKRDDLLRKLRSMKKEGMSKSKMMAACKSELAKCGAMERGKKMSKSESGSKDGITKVYEFLAKSYAKAVGMNEEMSESDKTKLAQIKLKKDKKEKLKKMLETQSGQAGQKDKMDTVDREPKQEQMSAQDGSTGSKGY